MKSLINSTTNINYNAIDISGIKDTKILAKDLDDEIKTFNLGYLIKTNAFDDKQLAKKLIEEDKAYLSIYFQIKYDIFSRDGVYFDLKNKEEMFSKDLLIKKKKNYISQGDLREILFDIEECFEFTLSNYAFDVWYNKLKIFPKNVLIKKKEKILMNETFKPKLSAFFKY